MSEDLLPDLLRLFRELELFAVERRPDSSIVAITHPPSWLTSIIGPFGDMPIHINEAFPFLESFVREAEAFWDAGAKGRISSGLFTPAGADHLVLRASALNLGTRCLLVLESLQGEADTRPVLQKAREHQLEHEQLARRMEGVKPFVSTIARLVTELRKTDLTGAQRELAEAIDSAAAHAQGVAAGTERPGRGR
jgi:hypothetical protein